jgi:hypothetical protein
MVCSDSDPVVLSGSAFERGRQQAERCPEAAAAVAAAVRGRLRQLADVVGRRGSTGYLRAQRELTERICPEAIEEIRGICAGFALREDELFAYLHLGVVGDLAAVGQAPEGCTAWAMPHPGCGTMVGKNRDFRGEHLALQRVFRHSDPSWGARRVLCVGSLGSPGAYSSGINSDGLAVVDTQVATSDHGVGWLRYFVMSRLLASCARVAEAVQTLRALEHAGGGTLVIGDASGAVAAVELGREAVEVEQPAGAWVARTNHFVSRRLAAKTLLDATEPLASSSPERLEVIRAALANGSEWDLDTAAATMASHGAGTREALCRHGQNGDARTISCSVFFCRPATLHFSSGPPCEAPWLRFTLREPQP